MSEPPINTKPVRAAAPRVGKFVTRHVASLAAKSGAMDPALIDAWPEIAGPELHTVCRPLRLRKQGRVHTLVVGVQSGAAAMRLQYAQNQILARAASHLNRPTLRKLVIEQSGTKGVDARTPGRRTKGSKRWSSGKLTGASLASAKPTPPPIPAASLAEALDQLRQTIEKRR